MVARSWLHSKSTSQVQSKVQLFNPGRKYDYCTHCDCTERHTQVWALQSDSITTLFLQWQSAPWSAPCPPPSGQQSWSLLVIDIFGQAEHFPSPPIVGLEWSVSRIYILLFPDTIATLYVAIFLVVHLSKTDSDRFSTNLSLDSNNFPTMYFSAADVVVWVSTFYTYPSVRGYVHCCVMGCS